MASETLVERLAPLSYGVVILGVLLLLSLAYAAVAEVRYRRAMKRLRRAAGDTI